MRLSPHFRTDEFACRCCGQVSPGGVGGVPGELVSILEGVRARFGAPVHITSGYRCRAHNDRVGGAPQSLHLMGLAADIVVQGVAAREVAEFLDPWHRGGLGRYDGFTHVDVREGRARWHG